MEALIQLKQFYENGFLSKEEYESKRIALIDQLSNTVRALVTSVRLSS